MKIKLLTIFLMAGLILSACGNKGNQQKEQEVKTEKKQETEKETKTMEEEKPLKDVKVLIETTEGNITVKLYDETPMHRDNFVKLVKSNFYDGVIFHRVIKNFMIQGGDPESKNPEANKQYGSGGPSYKIPAEFNSKLFHKKGALSAARTNNPEKASSGSQFYIVQGEKYSGADQLKQINPKFNYTPEQIEAYKTLGGTPHLDGEYTVFGEVTNGLNIVDKIAAVKTGKADRPVNDVIITKVTIIE